MAAKALEFLESAIQREKQHYIGVIDRPSSNTIEVKWTDLMRDCDDDILKWFSIFLFGKNRRFLLEQSSDITFYASSVKRKLIIKLSAPMASVTTSGSHVSMDNLLGIDFGFRQSMLRLGDSRSFMCDHWATYGMPELLYVWNWE